MPKIKCPDLGLVQIRPPRPPFFFFNFFWCGFFFSVNYVRGTIKTFLGDFTIMQFRPCCWFILQLSSMLLLTVDSKLIEIHNLCDAALFAKPLTYICRDPIAGFRAIPFVPTNRIHTKYFSLKSGKHGKHFCFRRIIKWVSKSKESVNNRRPCMQTWYYYKSDHTLEVGTQTQPCTSVVFGKRMHQQQRVAYQWSTSPSGKIQW